MCEHLKRCKTSTLIDGIAFSYQVLCHYNEPVLSIRRLSPFQLQGA